MIRIEEVTKRYDEHTVVDNISTTIPRGKFTSVIGPNGAGKSTLLQMIARLEPITEGAVLIDDLDVSTTPGPELARTMSILRQENHLVVRLTVRELVEFGRFPHTQGRLTADDKKYVDDAIEQMGLEHMADHALDELSGGQRQRAFVAMVLAQDTDYILLDEPLNNLDMRYAVSMMKMLRKACDEQGKTIVVVIHDINFAAAHSDHIIALKHGQLVHAGSPGEIMNKEVMRSIYDMDMQIELFNQNPVAIYFR